MRKTKGTGLGIDSAHGGQTVNTTTKVIMTIAKPYYPIGSVSCNTLRTVDLLKAFADTLEYLLSRNPDQDSPTIRAVIQEAREFQEKLACESTLAEDDAASEFLNETMFGTMDILSGPYFYFGPHPGDGSDFGYWLLDDIQQEFDGLQVSDTSEVPPDYTGEVLHINDHGNMTLYSAQAGNLSEVWSVV